MVYELIKRYLVQPKTSAKNVFMLSNRQGTLKITKSILTSM